VRFAKIWQASFAAAVEPAYMMRRIACDELRRSPVVRRKGDLTYWKPPPTRSEHAAQMIAHHATALAGV
jgi:hypothetical protein